jgi:S-adenosylmethionine hydrolase
MSIITLSSDFGLKDYFVGSLKGSIYAEFPEAKLIDLSHDIEPFHSIHAAYVLQAAHKKFPKNTVHLVCVDAEKSVLNRHVIIYWHDQYFIGADNGVFSILTHQDPADAIYEINIHDRFAEDATYLDILKTVAVHLAKGGKPNVVGIPLNALKDIKPPKMEVLNGGKTLQGTKLYTDHLGNVVFNISKKLFVEHGKGRPYQIAIDKHRIKTIYPSYAAYHISESLTNRADVVAIFNEAGYLEIGIFRAQPKITGTALTLLGFNFKNTIDINFL